MVLLNNIVAVSTALSLANALNINVASSGGNKTSGKQYGIMFEV